jgi:hypothetical protein
MDKILADLLNEYWDKVPLIIKARQRHIEGDHDLCWILGRTSDWNCPKVERIIPR